MGVLYYKYKICFYIGSFGGDCMKLLFLRMRIFKIIMWYINYVIINYIILIFFKFIYEF